MLGEWSKAGLAELSDSCGLLLSVSAVVDARPLGMIAQWIERSMDVAWTDAHRYHVVAHDARAACAAAKTGDATFRKPPKKQIPRGAHIHN